MKAAAIRGLLGLGRRAKTLGSQAIVTSRTNWVRFAKNTTCSFKLYHEKSLLSAVARSAWPVRITARDS
jgi:hypothetical protein